MSSALLVPVYVVAMIAANLSVAHFGPWISPLNSFFLIGLDLTLRDRLHDLWRGRGLLVKMGALIACASILSYMFNPASGRVALASFIAFACASTVDALVYGALYRRRYMTRTNGSNVAGALVDSVLFPSIAFGAFLPAIIAAQAFAKIGGGYLWALVLRGRRS